MEDEPPDYKFTRNLPAKHNDKEGTLLAPDISKNEIAVLNPSLYWTTKKGPWPFLYRTRKPLNKDKEYSVIDFRWLLTPTRLSSESRTLIDSEYNFESCGVEDPKITKNKIFYITYIAHDGLNALPAVATTKDFKTIEKRGPLMASISLEEAINIVQEPRYKKIWEKTLQENRKTKEKIKFKGEILLYNKDASVEYNSPTKEWILTHRLDPDIHIARAQNLEDFQEKEFWIEHLRKIRERTMMQAEPELVKIGLGSHPLKIKGRRIGLYHEVAGNGDYLTYNGSFFEVDKNFNPISRIKSPLLTPNHERDILYEPNEAGKPIAKKAIYFPTAMLPDPNDNQTLWIYSGRGDNRIDFRSTSLEWVLSELDNLCNKTEFAA